jgi:hypothetical protein
MTNPRVVVSFFVAAAIAFAALLYGSFDAKPASADHLCGGFITHLTGGATISTSTSTTRHSTFTAVQLPGGPVEQFRTRVVAQIGVSIVFDETVDGGPTSAAAQDALARARIALTAQLGPAATITGPEQSQTNRSPASQNPTNSLNHIETSVTTQTTLGPATILVGPDQGFVCFIPAGTSNVNTNTHTESFIDVITPAPGFLNFTELKLTGSGPQFVKPMIPQLTQLPVLGAIFTNRKRNTQPPPPLQVFITPNIVNPAPE